MLATSFDPRRSSAHRSADPNTSVIADSQHPLESASSAEDIDADLPLHLSIWQSLRCFFSPAILLLCSASCIRQTAAYAWTYNSKLYNDIYYPEYDIGLYLFSGSVIGGSIGIISGGCVSDRFVQRMGIQARVLVIVISQVISSTVHVKDVELTV